MKKLLTFFLTALLAFAVGWAETATLSNANIVAAGTGKTGYQSWTISDSNNKTWNAYAIKNQHSNATSAYHYLQIRKYASNTAYYIQVPEFGTKITQIVMTVSGSSQTMTGGGNSATLYFSNSNSTSATGAGVASATGASSVTIDCSSLNLNSGYITASAAVRIWDVTVTYEGGGVTPPAEENWYRKVTTANDLVAGNQYIFIKEDGSSSVGMGAVVNYYGTSVTGLTVSDNKVNIGGTDVVEYVLGGSSSGWTFRNPNTSSYIGARSTSGDGLINGSTASDNMMKWTIASNGRVQNNGNSAYVRCNSANSFGLYSSGTFAYLYVKDLEDCEAPTFSPDGGTFIGSVIVTITCDTEDATIYYTTDGTDPTTSSNSVANGGTVELTESCTLKAMAVKSGMDNSPIVTSEDYTINPAGGGSSSTIYRKVTSVDDLIPGQKYIIMYENGSSSVGMGAYDGSKHFSGIQNLTVSNNQVDIAGKDVLELILGGATDAWTLYTGSGYIQGNDAVSFSVVNSATENSAKWQITSTDGGFVVKNAQYERYIRYYSGGTFRHYNTSNGEWAYLYVQSNVPTLHVEPNPLNINDDNSADGRKGTFSVTGENLGTDNVGVTLDNSHSTNFTFTTSDEWWGFNNNNGSVNGTDTVTYTGHALSATGLYNIANNLTSVQERINYLYTGPIYVIGDVNNTWWNTTQGAQLTRDENGIYTATVSVQQSNDAGYISFTKQLGADQSGNQFGPVAFNWNLAGNEGTYQPIDTLGNAYNIRLVPGTYTITINPATNEFMITPYVITVTISPEDGSTFTGSTISGTITDSPAGTIEWSTDGQNWQTYNDGFTATAANVGDQVTIYARSTSNGVTSDVATATYTRVAAPAPAAPTFSRSSGDVSKGTVITITAPAGTTLYVDGQQVTSPYDVVINRSTTISAYCVNDEGTQSEIVTNTYKISAVCEASIVFSGSGGTGDSNTNIGGQSIPNEYIESGADLIVSSSTSGSVYNGKGTNGLKMGSGSYTGSFTINLNSQAEGWKVSKIIVNALAWSSSEGQLHVTTSADATGSTQSLSYSDFDNYEFDFDGSEITSFTVSTTSEGKRCYVKSVTLVYNCGAVVEAPVITPATGTYYENQTVTITAQDGATIYYTTNGSEPTTSSAVYNGSFTAAYNAGSTTTIKAIAVDEEDNVSEVATATYTWATPSVTIHPDSRNTAATFINVTLTSEPADGTIYYTTDGSTPTATDGTPYNGGFTVNIPNDGDAVTVKAITVAGDLTSPVATATYTHKENALTVNAPFFSPLQNRTYYGDQTLQIASTTPNVDIYYEIVEVSGETAPTSSDVEDPTHVSTYYDGTPIEMTPGHSYYIKAIAYVGNYVSTVSEGYYIVKEFTQTGYYFQNLKDFNDNCPTGVTAHLVNPVQVVYHSTYTNDGTMAEYCYVRDNTDYALIYFGKADYNDYHIFEMGDWIDGSLIAGVTSKPSFGYHIQIGTGSHQVTSWPTSTIGHSAILPEETTCKVIYDGDQDGENSWAHYVHLRYSTLSGVDDESASDMKHNGFITDHSNTELNYYDKFYRWSAGSCTYLGDTYTIHALGDYDQAFFTAKQDAGAKFDVYGIVDWYNTKGYQICPIDFLWIFKPEISLQSGTYLTTQTVNITAEHPEWAAEGVVIYYKTDDMEEWAIYTGPLTVNSDTHLQAYAEVPAHKSGTYGGANYNDYVRSEVVEATYNFDSVNDPVIDPESQTKEVGESVDVYVMDTNDNASVVTVYTTDGTRPSASNGTVLNEITQFTLTTTTTVSAVSYLVVAVGDTIWSNVVTRTYEFIEDNGKTYNLLTSNPVVGNVYVIVNKAASVGLSTTQGETNRAGVGVKFTDDATKAVVKGNTSLAEFMLESATAGRYYFRQVGTQNYLTITTYEYANLMTGDAGTDAEASVTVGSNNSDVDKSYPATVTFTYEGNSRYLRYYAGGRFFTTYSDATNQSDIFLYGIEAPVVLDPSIAPNSQFVGEESLTVTVTPASENPEGAVTYYTTDGSDPRTSTTRQLWTSENGVFDVNTTTTVKAVSGIEFADTYVWSNVVSETYTFIEPTTLAWIEEHGVVTTDYVVADELIGTWAVDNPETGKRFLWAKDQGNTSIDKRPAKTAGQRDYVKDILKYPRVLDGEAQANWDESNWVILDFSNISADPFEFVGHKITAKSVIGKYSDNKNYRIVLEQAPDLVNNNPLHMDVPEYEGYNGPFPESKLGTKYDLAYNTFVPANFMTENHNLLENGKVVGGFVADETALPGLAGDSLYFVNPKIQEVAHIWAVWNGVDEAGDIFTVYATEHQEKENINAWHLNGTFRVDWTYNCTGVDPDNSAVHVYDRPEGLVPNMAYEFHAVVMKPAGNSTRLAVAPQGTAEPGTPSPSYMVYPLDMQDGGTPTAVIELNAMKTVVGVTYYNLMGQESSKPFEGINIVVTRYSDGSMMTRKVLR